MRTHTDRAYQGRSSKRPRMHPRDCLCEPPGHMRQSIHHYPQKKAMNQLYPATMIGTTRYSQRLFRAHIQHQESSKRPHGAAGECCTQYTARITVCSLIRLLGKRMQVSVGKPSQSENRDVEGYICSVKEVVLNRFSSDSTAKSLPACTNRT